MAKNFRRILATTMVMCMLVSALPMQALAAEDTTITATETITGGDITITFTPTENEGESSVDVSGTNESGATVDLGGSSVTTTETTTDGNGTVTESTSTEVKLTGTETTTDGTVKDVTYQDKTTDTTITGSDGSVTEKTVNDGSETKVWDVEEDTLGDDFVKVEIIPGETTVGITKVEGTEHAETTTVNGTVITDTTYEADRTVTATTSDKETTVNDTNSGLVGEEKTDLQGLAPVYDKINGVKEDKGGMFDYQFNSGATSDFSNPSKWTDMPEGAELRYVGTGEHSKYYVATAYVVYEKDDAGNTIYDSEGKPVIKEIRRYEDETSATITVDGEPLTELPEGITLEPVYDNYGGSRPFIFMLMDKNKNKFYGYCCDLDTATSDGKYYSITNLEDSDYYASEESEEHIRSIVMNGYWGTTDIPDENGDYAMGSLESIKEKMIAAIDAGEYPNTELTAPVLDPNNKYQPVTDENGNIVYTTKTMKEMIEGLTSGEALLATQAAIWSYANGSYGVHSGNDGSIILDPDGYKWNHDAMGNSKTAGGYTNGEAMDDFASAAVDFMYTWLINLQTEEESTIVINDKNFVEDMGLTVHDKAVDKNGNDIAANIDDNADNDVYNTDLNFKLAFIPGAQDDLLVQISYTDYEGNPQTVIRRLAGEQTDYDMVEYDKNDGSYVLRGLKLSENKDFNFDLRLEGTQYLENGVYVYQAVGGRGVSQAFVGIAEGDRNVDVSVGVTIKFDVDENNHVVAERTWHDEYDPSNNPPSPPEYPVDPANFEEVPPPQIFRLNNQDGLETIPEEPVPLAAPVITGDGSAMWMAVVLFALFGMVAINLSDKKRQHETF